MLLIFVKHPYLGEVKTRLGKELGMQVAKQVYEDLLLHTANIVASLTFPKQIWFGNDFQEDLFWKEKGFNRFAQQGNDLGEKMRYAFEQAFLQGENKVLIIGSDCPYLTTEHIEAAWNFLDSNELVLGPAKDGGYYLLGMRNFYPALFENKKWSTASVLADSLKDAERLNLSYKLLPVLSDIDTAEDYKQWLDFC